jgi:adenine-specific DNA-methyltransferase
VQSESAIRPTRTTRGKHLQLSQFSPDDRLSYGSSGAGNAIIQGDNLAVLRILEPQLAGSLSCIYIDPPYNNQECYTHYKDALPHEEWLQQIIPRLELLWKLLRPGGSLWISIDDRELHYLKVALDSICGRDAFVATVVWHHRISRENRRAFSYNHEYIVVYAKDAAVFRETRRRLPLTPTLLERYRNPDGDPRGAWQSVSVNVQAGHGTKSQFYDFVAPNGRRYSPPNGRCWVFTKERMREEILKNNIWFGKDGTGVPRMKRFLPDNGCGLTPETLWRAEDVGTTSSAKKHLIELFPRAPQFDTPKPEALLARILHIASSPGDLVLDAYLGSGTSAAAAHKMQRRYIGIERSRSAALLAAARLRHVVDGEGGGISSSVDWTGGGGFKFLRLP